MFSFLASTFSGRKKLETSVEGNFIRYVRGKTPRTISVDTTLYIGPGLNDDEFVMRIEDTEWDLNSKSNFSVVRNKERKAAVCWNDGVDTVFSIFVLSDPSVLDDLLQVVCKMLWKTTYGEDLKEDEADEAMKLISTQSFPFHLETLQVFEEEQPRKSIAPTQRKSVRPTQEKVLYSCNGDLFLLDPKTNIFHERGCDFTLSYVQVGKLEEFKSIISVSAQDGETVLIAPISSEMNAQILLDHNAITFMTFTNAVITWAFKFSDEREIEAKKYLVAKLWESKAREDFNSLDEDSQAYILQSYVEGQSGKKEELDESDYMDIDGSDEELEEYSDESDESDEEEEYRASGQLGRRKSRDSRKTSDGERNSLLVDSARHNRAFVVRGDQLGIFEDSDATYLGKISLGTRPEQIILHNKEGRMLLAAEGKVKELDLTKEKIISEYTAGDSRDDQVKAIGQVQKYAELSANPLFAAMNNKSIWAMDTRMSGKNQALNKETYKTNPKFRVFATSSKGQLAVGSEDGIIRMYSGVAGMPKPTGSGEYPKRAKTNLPGFGDPIIGIDTSSDGLWILATCKNYLIVVPTAYKDKTGFEDRMGKDKPSPRRLLLHPKDIERMGGEVSFTRATFNTGADGDTWIVTSTGNFVITWNFKSVQKDILHHYTIKSMHDYVSTDQFVALSPDQVGASKAPIVVALDNDVIIQKRVQAKSNPFQSKPRF